MPVASVPMSIKLDANFRGRLNELALLRKRTAHSIAREAVEQHIALEEAREKANQDALDAWRDYRDTGLHATGDEVLRWVESWGATEELPAPQCHS